VRRRSWSGFLGIIGLAIGAPVSAGAMEFALVRVAAPGLCRPHCPVVIEARGDISVDSGKRFMDFLQSTALGTANRNVVLVHSPGGNVYGALQLGQMWRRLGATVIVARPLRAGLEAGRTAAGLGPAHCASACVFALMGGTRRLVPNRSLVAVHQTHRVFFERDGSDASRVVRRLVGSTAISNELRAYAQGMGVSPELIALAQSTPPTRIRILSKAELRRFRLEKSR
jgi:hypothetical protein